jgi:hypothetical protein
MGASSVASAQRGGDSFRIVANDMVIGLVQGQKLRLTVFNPSPSTAAGAHVKVFDGSGFLLLSSENVAVPGGEFRTFDISYNDLGQMPGESATGRRQIRADMTIVFTGLESEARIFRPSFELVDEVRGQSILIGMLLPAIQKVRA